MKEYEVTLDIQPMISFVEAKNKEEAVKKAVQFFMDEPNNFYDLELTVEPENVLELD